MKQSLCYALFSALITAAFITAVPAFAKDGAGSAPTHVSLVHTSDLDLATPSGQRRLDQRVARAAREVCGTASNADVEGKNEVRRCRDEAIARASLQRDALLAAAPRSAVIAVTATR